MSDRTIKFKRLYWIFLIFSLLLNVGPLAGYSITALINADLVHEKVALTMTVFIVLILTIVSMINRVTMKSRLWIVLIGIYMCIDYILTPLIIIAVCQILDEIVVTPLKKTYKNKLTINKEMDMRL
jgi:hypothetical protein